MSLPPWARAFVYILIVLAFIHNYLKPTVLQGQLWVTNKAGVNNPGKDYELRHGISAFRVNSDGRWSLTTQRKLPGSVMVTIVHPKGTHIGDAKLTMPVPVWSGFRPKQYSITRNVQGQFSVTETTSIETQISNTAYAQSQSPSRDPNLSMEKWYVKINELQIKESGDSRGHTGELYFKIYLNGQELEQTGLPQKHYSNTHLLINDNTTTTFKNLGFFLPMSVPNATESTLLIRIYDYDLIGEDDKVAHFKIIFNSNTKLATLQTYKTEKLKRNWLDNSSIVIEFLKKTY